MKKNRLIVLILLSLPVLVLSSCYWRPNFSSGGLQVDVSRIAARVGGPSDVVRVYLIADGLLFSTGGGTPFVAEVPATGTSQEQKISITGLPVSPKYRVMVGVGMMNGGVFEPTSYGDSGQFVISPNSDTAVSVTLQSIVFPNGAAPVPPSPDLLGKNVKGVVGSDSYVYAVEDKAFYLTNYSPSTWYLDTFGSYNLGQDLEGTGVSGYSINGVSRGSFINSSFSLDTTTGILPFYNNDYWNFVKDFTMTLGGSRDIKESGSFYIPYTEGDYAIFFRRGGGLGGAYVLSSDTGNPSVWRWSNVDLAGVQDMVNSYQYTYYAAGGSVFALPPAFLTDAPPNLKGRRIDLPAPAPVLSLGIRTGEGNTLYLGTTNGVYTMDVSESTGPADADNYINIYSGPSQDAPLDITAGDQIERIAIPAYYSNREAYLSRYYLYIRYLDYSGIEHFEKIPFFAVLPGRATGLAWDDNGYSVYISGTEGLAAVYIGS
jgi:hypothetical protein